MTISASALLTYSIIFVFGLVVGSFINVVIYRVPRGESVVTERSHCVSCGKILSAAELIPVISYIILRGRCRQCKSSISPLYPAVEILVGLLFLSIFFKYSFSFEFLCYSIFFALLIGAGIIDVQWMIIPNRLIFYSLVIATLAFSYNIIRPMAIYGGNQSPFLPLMGLLPGAVFFFLIYVVSFFIFKKENSIGMGDIKLLIPIGIILGFDRCLFAVFISIISGGVIGLALIILGIKKRRDSISFGPFLVIGSYIALLLS
ncbi:MAG: prepilin peptidase [Synergistaceae bacterium]|nr:prepilin peptidase [Synergistaceae bacterium]